LSNSLNNIGKEKAKLLVGFSHELSEDVDLPVAFNGIPAPVRDAYTSPHTALRQWSGAIDNPLFGKFPIATAMKDSVTGSPYKFDLAQTTPLFSNAQMGSVIWAIKDNWNILEHISLLRAHLKPGTARDAIWYPDVGTLYIVTKGTGQFHIVIPGQPPMPFDVQLYDYVFIPTGVLHTFLNTSPTDDFEVVALFTDANPLPEVSLSVATSFFPPGIVNAGLTQYGSVQKQGTPLQGLKFNKTSPYLLRIPKQPK
jgi:oxalate decarboxylase/phosphoglucose isomerase-like protein (cupin superfamily)